MLMEFYRKDGSWRVSASGQGFNGGLDALVHFFGGTIAEESSEAGALARIEQIPEDSNQESTKIPIIPVQEPVEPPTNISFLQRLFRPIFSEKTSTNKQYTSHLRDYWKPLGTSVKISDVVIDGGLIYFGSGLTCINGSQPEPALIDPKLPVANITLADYQQRLLSYWSSYSQASPEARAAYIKWLINGRNDPLAEVGYVFLYFYGLERRALADTETDATAKADLPKIIQEIERLLGIYDGNGSFRNYASGLLDLLKLDRTEFTASKQYLCSPPDFKSGSWTLPLTLKLALGQLALDQLPVPADWAYAWMMADPTTRLRTSAKRCTVEFKQLFLAQYHESFGNGISLPNNKTKIKVSYYTASATFFSNRTIERKLDIPDVTVLTSRIKKLQALANQCAETLNAYSRFLGRKPELAGTLDALLELPYLLWQLSQKQHLQTIKHALETTKAPVVIPFVQLKAWLPEWHTITKSRVAAFINRLAEAGLGMEPDLRFGGPIPNMNTKVALFLDDGQWIAPNPRYATAALTLHLAVAVSLADGEIGKAERDLLIQQIEGWLHLEPVEKNRLHAHLRWLLLENLDFKNIKKRVETLPVAARESLADFVVLVASADNKITPNEVKILEKIYKTLNLDIQSLYGRLHGTSTDEPVTVRPPMPTSEGFSIPNSPKPEADFQLDMNRVEALKHESKRVTDMLVALFEQEAPAESVSPIQIPTEMPEKPDANLLGLDNAHSDLIKLLCSRVQWSRVELEEIAADSGMMLDGTLAQINEAAYDAFDAALTEGDDPIDINQDILKELLGGNDPS